MFSSFSFHYVRNRNGNKFEETNNNFEIQMQYGKFDETEIYLEISTNISLDNKSI